VADVPIGVLALRTTTPILRVRSEHFGAGASAANAAHFPAAMGTGMEGKERAPVTAKIDEIFQAGAESVFSRGVTPFAANQVAAHIEVNGTFRSYVRPSVA
jgi:hypothetical protein